MDVLLGVAGIVVSVGLFILGYRQTVGARMERAVAANADLERLLVRRVVLEGYAPNREALGRLLEAKARDARVPVGALHSEKQLLNTVYSRLLESDLIPPDRRDALLSQVVPALIVAEHQSLLEQLTFDVTESRRRYISQVTVFLLAMGSVASIIGGAIAVLPEFHTFRPDIRQLLANALPTVLVSLAIIFSLVSFYRLRALQSGSREIAVDRYSQFERDVLKQLGKAGAHWRRAAPNDDFDFWVETRDRHFLVKVKAWDKVPPGKVVAAVVMRLAEAVRGAERTMGVVVTSVPIQSPSEHPADASVRLMTLRQFRDFLASG